jgi:hypothetical protein
LSVLSFGPRKIRALHWTTPGHGPTFTAMPVITLNRVAHFAAAHRCYRDDGSDERLFVDCSAEVTRDG